MKLINIFLVEIIIDIIFKNPVIFCSFFFIKVIVLIILYIIFIIQVTIQKKPNIKIKDILDIKSILYINISDVKAC